MEETRTFKCRCCKKITCERVKSQTYCGDSVCQRKRKNAWRRAKYESDLDYRLNQKESTRAWLTSVGGASVYYRRYRAERAQNKKALIETKRAAKPAELIGTESSVKINMSSVRANSDAILPKIPLNSGKYRICPVGGANSDAFLAKIEVITAR